MTTNFYFTHPIAASFDPRIHALEEKLHGKGYGLYWYIREKLSYFPRKCCRLEDLKPFATKYYTYRLMQQVVLESGLFEIERGYIIPLRLKCEGETNGEELIFGDTPTKPKRGNKTSRKSCGTESKNSGTEAKSSRTESKNSENSSISDENPMKNDENPSKNSGKQAENDEKRTENDEKQAFFDEKQAENGKKRTKNDEKQAIFNEKQAFFDGKQAENSGKRVKKALNKQPERTDKQEFAYNLFETSNTNTSIYIKKEKEKERKIISSTEKRRRRKRGKGGKGREQPERPVCPSVPAARPLLAAIRGAFGHRQAMDRDSLHEKRFRCPADEALRPGQRAVRRAHHRLRTGRQTPHPGGRDELFHLLRHPPRHLEGAAQPATGARAARHVPVRQPLPPRAAAGRTPHVQRSPHPRQRPSTSRRPLPVE